MISPSLPCLVYFVICISGEGFILPLHLNYICVCIYMLVHLITVFYLYVLAYYNSVCIDMFVYLIKVSVLLCLCRLYNIIVEYT